MTIHFYFSSISNTVLEPSFDRFKITWQKRIPKDLNTELKPVFLSLCVWLTDPGSWHGFAYGPSFYMEINSGPGATLSTFQIKQASNQEDFEVFHRNWVLAIEQGHWSSNAIDYSLIIDTLFRFYYFFFLFFVIIFRVCTEVVHCVVDDYIHITSFILSSVCYNNYHVQQQNAPSFFYFSFFPSRSISLQSGYR